MKTKVKRFSGICIFVVFVILTFYSSTAFSAVPGVINYQGSLSDAGGNPVNATFNITFTLYDVDAGPGTTLWQEVQSVTVTNGQFSVQLGADALNPLDPALVDDPIFLGVQVGGDAEMTPRQKFTSTAFAFKAKTVENDTLNSLSCAANEIPKFNGSIWVCAADDDSTDTNAATLCPNGTFLNGDGSCDPVITDTNTTYSAGSGLSLNGTTFSIPTGAIDASHLATGSVNGSEIAPGAVGLSELANSAKGVGVSGVIIIPASEFQPISDTSDYVFSLSSGYIIPGNLNAFLCLVAPVNLPHGVTVTHFEISAWDNANIINVGTFSLRRVAFANSYYIEGCILADLFSPLNTRFYGARVRYN